LDEAEIRDVAKQISAADIHCVAISSVFSPVNPDREIRAAEIILSEIPDARLSLSHEIGVDRLLEREKCSDYKRLPIATGRRKIVQSFKQC
jgi:N-methylhydantoinase A/oxoprolinase/acetone carboxylase beta subunit